MTGPSSIKPKEFSSKSNRWLRPFLLTLYQMSRRRSLPARTASGITASPRPSTAVDTQPEASSADQAAAAAASCGTQQHAGRPVQAPLRRPLSAPSLAACRRGDAKTPKLYCPRWSKTDSTGERISPSSSRSSESAAPPSRTGRESASPTSPRCRRRSCEGWINGWNRRFHPYFDASRFSGCARDCRRHSL